MSEHVETLSVIGHDRVTAAKPLRSFTSVSDISCQYGKGPAAEIDRPGSTPGGKIGDRSRPLVSAPSASPEKNWGPEKFGNPENSVGFLLGAEVVCELVGFWALGLAALGAMGWRF